MAAIKKKIKCESCDGVGNHGKDKRCKYIQCNECKGTGETEPSFDYWRDRFPDITSSDLERLIDHREGIESLVEASDTHIICLVANRDNELVSTHKIEAHMDYLNDLIEETSNYSGDWGDYHIVDSIIYKRQSYYIINDGRYEGSGDIDISTLLPKASLTFSEVKALLVESVKNSDEILRNVVVDIIARTRN